METSNTVSDNNFSNPVDKADPVAKTGPWPGGGEAGDLWAGLDFPLTEFQQYLSEAVDIVLRRYASLDESPAFCGQDAQAIRACFDEPLPEQGMPVSELLQRVERDIFASATLNLAPKMFAYVMSGGNQLGVIADLLSSALDQNVTKWHLAPALSEVEQRVIHWAAQFIGAHQHTAGGIVSGGSGANLMGLSVARNIHFARQRIREKGLYGLAPATLYASSETHNSVTKSVELLGLGRENYRQIPIHADFTIQIDALVAQIEQDRAHGLQPFCLIANAGTVNTGAIDPIEEMAEIAQHYGLWLHVDGCYGGLASALPELQSSYAGLTRADSIALDFHKWWYQPFEIGCTLVKNWAQLRDSYYTPAQYLDEGRPEQHMPTGQRLNITEHHFDLSRNGKALKAWMTLKGFGAERMRQMIAKDIQLTAYLHRQLSQARDFEVMSEGLLGIVCFRYRPACVVSDELLDRLNENMIGALERDGRVFITGTRLHGRRVIRACLINHRMRPEDLDYLVGVIRQIGAEAWRQFETVG